MKSPVLVTDHLRNANINYTRLNEWMNLAMKQSQEIPCSTMQYENCKMYLVKREQKNPKTKPFLVAVKDYIFKINHSHSKNRNTLFVRDEK